MRGFRNKQSLMNHIKNGRTHEKEYNCSPNEYEQKAVRLFESPVGGNITGHVDKDGFIIRYDYKENDFVKGKIEKGIYTMFKPKDGAKYYENQRKGDIKRGGKI